MKMILGHEKQRKILAASFKNNRMAHAYLFLGKEGVGKKLLAVEFARLVNCENPDFNSFQACSMCESCEKQARSLNPDIITIEPDGSTIKTKQIVELLQEQSFSSFYNKYKFVIINNAEKITKDAVPRLLKTIEEPASKSVYILIASNYNFILPTIRSRCQVVKFGYLTASQVKEILSKEVSLSRDVIEYASKSAEGSAAKALELVQEDNIELREALFSMLEAYYAVKQLLDIKTIKSKYEKFSTKATDLLAGFFYDVFKMKTGVGVIANSDKESLIKKYSALLPLDNVSYILKALDSSRSQITRNLSMNQDLLINNIIVKGDVRNG